LGLPTLITWRAIDAQKRRAENVDVDNDNAAFPGNRLIFTGAVTVSSTNPQANAAHEPVRHAQHHFTTRQRTAGFHKTQVPA